MNVAIIGAGFTGLTAAYQLLKAGHTVTLFEKSDIPGGLAIGFNPLDPKTKKNIWEWSLEAHYHHWFTNDKNVLDLAKELDFDVLIKRPKTSVFLEDAFFQLDSPLKVLTFPQLSLVDRLRMAATLGALRYNPFWQPLERIKAVEFLPTVMGKAAYKKLWEPQLKNKFGSYMSEISLAWFWARIKKRTSSLAYPKGGFLAFAQFLTETIQKKGATVLFNTEIKEIKSENGKVSINYTLKTKNYTLTYDAVIVTVPSFAFITIAPQLPQAYKQQLQQLKGLGAINLILRLKKQFFLDNTYWLSVCDTTSPIMAIVEHTNFMDKKYYNNEHLIYLGNYIPHTHPYMKMQPEELLKIYDPFLQKIHPGYEKDIIQAHVFTAPFAQPIIPLEYSKIMPPFQTPLPNVFLANMQQVYPWDRGTNYAVELGEKVAKLIGQSNF